MKVPSIDSRERETKNSKRTADKTKTIENLQHYASITIGDDHGNAMVERGNLQLRDI